MSQEFIVPYYDGGSGGRVWNRGLGVRAGIKAISVGNSLDQTFGLLANQEPGANASQTEVAANASLRLLLRTRNAHATLPTRLDTLPWIQDVEMGNAHTHEEDRLRNTSTAEALPKSCKGNTRPNTMASPSPYRSD